MSEMTEQTDLTPSGIDRRSALKKVAVGGAVAWSAPTVLSSRAHAVELFNGCTAKCAFSGNAGITGGSVLFQACGTGPAGQQGIFFTVSAGSGTASGECGCGATPSVVSVTIDGEAQGFIPDPGNGQFAVEGFTFGIEVQVSCADRQGNTLISTCTGTGVITCPQTGDCAGNCQSLPGKSPTFNATGLSCTVTECVLA